MYGARGAATWSLFPLCCLAAPPQVPKPTPPAEPPITAASTSPETRHEMTPSDVEAFLDGLVPLQLLREDIAGAVIVVVKNGDIYFNKGYGFADMKWKVPICPTA